MSRQVRRSRKFWAQIVAEFDATEDVSKTAFCAHHGVSISTFSRWYRRLRAAHPQEMMATQGSAFVEVERTSRKGGAWDVAPPTETIMECGRFRLRLETLPDPAWLAELIRTTQGDF